MPKRINVKGPIVGNDDAWIYHLFGWDCTCPNDIEEGLEEAAGEDVLLEINSPGGYVSYGYEMYTKIMEYEGKVTAHVITASSAASLLVCAADEALISDTGWIMIHCASIGGASGNSTDMQRQADRLKAVDEGIINAYVRKTEKSREELLQMMKDETYMDPKTAIENGFVDGYMFGDPNGEDENKTNLAKAVAAEIPIIPEDKIKELALAMKSAKETGSTAVATSQQEEGQSTAGNAVSADKNHEEEGKHVTLQELMEQNPEAKAEMDEAVKEAKASAKAEERERIKSLDAIAGTVTAEALEDAKYGEHPKDGKTLAYEALVSGNQAAKNYMQQAIDDSAESGAGDVGIGTPDAGREPEDEENELANYVNKKEV